MSLPPLISSQRYLDPKKVQHKATTFKAFIVSTVAIELRGVQYRVLLDGHHNFAAAKLAGVEPTWRGPSLKMQRFIARHTKAEVANFLINNLTDSDWYFIDTGQVVTELLAIA
jgi:ParB-like chromosome segregation protein Spo0J